MLQGIPRQRAQHRVHRFALVRKAAKFLGNEGLDAQAIREMLAILESAGVLDSPEALCEAPFKPKRRLRRRQTRFSDGTFPVFYCALERETAQAEAEYWFADFAGRPQGKRTALYSCFACDFSGETKDLRPQQGRWPKLTHAHDYTFCNALGAEALEENLDALLAPSVRRAGGANLAVFAKRAVSNPGDLVRMTATYNPATEEVTVCRAPEASGA